MTHPTDSVSEADLHAYIDDQLTPARRIAVEDYLSAQPELAAQVMADLRGRDELRLAMAEATPVVTLAAQDAARRLEKGLAHQTYAGKLRRVAAVAMLIGLGWLAHTEFASMRSWTAASASVMPAYVGEATRAYRTALLRASMHSQHVQPDYDREDIRAATSINMPALLQGWHVLDVQIFPSSSGPAVETTIKARDLGTLSLFAVKPGRFDVVPATSASSNGVTAAYWQTGDVAYALVGTTESTVLSEAAAKLSAALY